MPNRRALEMTVIVVLLVLPARAMVRIWLRKHLATSGEGPTATAAAIAETIL